MSEFDDINKRLESDMLTYSDLASVDAQDNGERMVKLAQAGNLLVKPNDPNMQQFTGNSIYVRRSVRDMLGKVCLGLAQEDSDLQLLVVYGYRPLSIQTANHEKVKQGLKKTLSGLELTEAAHRSVAEPSVAGHPTGGALDVQLARAGMPLPFGTQIREFVPQTYVFSPFIDAIAAFNRAMLRKYMLDSGFAPFDGEWWHFSYGDREWAKFYSKPNAIYKQLEFKSI